MRFIKRHLNHHQEPFNALPLAPHRVPRSVRTRKTWTASRAGSQAAPARRCRRGCAPVPSAPTSADRCAHFRRTAGSSASSRPTHSHVWRWVRRVTTGLSNRCGCRRAICREAKDCWRWSPRCRRRDRGAGGGQPLLSPRTAGSAGTSSDAASGPPRSRSCCRCLRSGSR